MRRMYLTEGLAVFAALSVVLVGNAAQAHEPVFSPGPHTIYEGGVATSVSSTVDDDGGPVGFSSGLVYGLTADLNLAAGLPVVAGREADHGPSVAVGDPVVQVKWRPWKNLVPRRIDSLSLIGGVKVPAGHHDVSSGNTGYTFGVTAAREHQRYYLFGSARYSTQSVGIDGTKPGDVFQYDFVTGVRPFVLEYDQPDAVVLVELNGTTTRPPQSANGHGAEGGAEQHTETLRRGLGSDDEYRTRRQAHSGGPAQFRGAQAAGTELAATPELLLSWGPIMLKGGVQFPFFDTFDEKDATPTYRVKTDIWAAGIGRPMHLALDDDGRLLVPAYQRDRIQIFDGPGDEVDRFGGDWLDAPSAVDVGPGGKVYVADFYNHRFHVLSRDGEVEETVGEKGKAPGQFTYPTDIEVTPSGDIWVADAYAHRIQMFGPKGTQRRTIGEKGGGGAGRFHVATGLDRGPDGLLYVADFKNDRIQVLRPDGTPVSVLEGASEGDRGMSRPTEVVATADRLCVVDHGNDQIDVYNK